MAITLTVCFLSLPLPQDYQLHVDPDHVYLTPSMLPSEQRQSWEVAGKHLRLMNKPSTSHHVSTTKPTLNLDTTVNTGTLLWPEGSSWDVSSGSAGNSTLSRGSWDCCRSLVSSGGTGSYWEKKGAAGEGRWSATQRCPQACPPPHPGPRWRAFRGGWGPSLRDKRVHWTLRNQETQCDMGNF